MKVEVDDALLERIMEVMEHVSSGVLGYGSFDSDMRSDIKSIMLELETAMVTAREGNAPMRLSEVARIIRG